MTNHVRAELARQGFEGDRVQVERMLNMRFEGTDTALMVLPGLNDGGGDEDFEAAFKKVYRAEFGFLLETKGIIVDDIKVSFLATKSHSRLYDLRAPQVRGIGKTFDDLGESVYSEVECIKKTPVDQSKADSTNSTYFDRVGRVHDTPVFLLANLSIGDEIVGPAMVIDNTQTIVVVPGARAVLTSKHLYLTLE